MTREEASRHIKAYLDLILSVDLIKEAGEVQEGVLYSLLMDRLDLETFNNLVSRLVATGLVKKSGFTLSWVKSE